VATAKHCGVEPLAFRHPSNSHLVCFYQLSCGSVVYWLGPLTCDSEVAVATPPHARMTSSTKPEVHNISQHRKRKNEPRPRIICVENLWQFGYLVFVIYWRTDRQTDTLIAILRIPSRGEVANQRLYISRYDKFLLGTLYQLRVRLRIHPGQWRRHSGIEVTNVGSWLIGRRLVPV